MLSFASAAYTAGKVLVSTFTANLETLSEHPDTIHWRERDEAGWQACRRNCQPPEVVMLRYADWLAGQARVRRLPGGRRLHVRVLRSNHLKHARKIIK
jgi:hypothetical protein